MIVKKKSEEAERKRAYTKRVLELLYPEEHASSVSSVDDREGTSAAPESQSEMTSNGDTGICSTLEVTEKVQLKQFKRYGVSSPPVDLELSSCQGNLQDQTADVEHSSSEEQEPFNDDLRSTRRRRRRKRQKTSHDLPTTSSAEVQSGSSGSQIKVTEPVEPTEPMTKNRKRKLKKKLKHAERNHTQSSEFVYKDIHETRTENICSETHGAGKL